MASLSYKRSRWIAILLFLGITSISPAQTPEPEWRTWVSSEGAKMEAYLKEVTPAGIVIVRRDGNEFTVPLARFSESDRAYVEQWQTEKRAGTASSGTGRVDLTATDFPRRHQIEGVEQVRTASNEPAEAGAIRAILQFHKMQPDPALGQRLAARKNNGDFAIANADLVTVLRTLPVQTHPFTLPPLDQRRNRNSPDPTVPNAIRKAISLDLPVLIVHRPDIVEDSTEYVAVATGYDERSLFAIEAEGSRKAIPLDWRTLEESLVQALVIVPTQPSGESPATSNVSQATPEFLNRVSATIRQMAGQNAQALTAALTEQTFAASVRDVNRSDLRNRMAGTRTFARQGGVPEIAAALNRGSVVIVPQTFDGGSGFALIFELGADGFSAVEFPPDGSFRRVTLSDADLASRWLTRDENNYRLDLIEIAVPAPQ